MERCPPELLQAIFALSCTDGGLTGCSLSLVSKYVHSASQSARYQCVSLSGRQQIALFAQLTQKSRAAQTVRRLFLCDERLDGNGSQAGEAGALPKGAMKLTGKLKLYAKIFDRSNHSSVDRQQGIARLISDILFSVAASLEALSLVFSSDKISLPITHVLPHLETLTTYRAALDFSGTIPDEGDVPMPALRRMHLITPVLSYPWINVIWHAPYLTHLCASEYGSVPELPRCAEIFMAQPAADTRDWGGTVNTPTSSMPSDDQPSRKAKILGLLRKLEDIGFTRISCDVESPTSVQRGHIMCAVRDRWLS